MNQPDFYQETFGKWILTGEHSVLRGAPALVFPLPEKKMVFRFWSSDQSFDLKFSGSRGKEVEILSWALVERLFKRLGIDRAQVQGLLEIASELPVGTGLGASAALCAGMAHWSFYMGWISGGESYGLARFLEDLFHGESSGVDVAVALSGQGLRFVREGRRDPIICRWQPHLYLSYSGIRGVTSECVTKVKEQLRINPPRGFEIDQRMARSTEVAETALGKENQEMGLELLIQSLELARSCFEDWQLIPDEMARHCSKLRALGALALKPTGSGGGGYVLSLWDDKPQNSDLGLFSTFGS